MLKVDTTIFIQVAIFISLMVVLHLLLFTPFLKYLEARQARIEGDKKEAERLRVEAQMRRQQWEEGLRQAELLASAERGRIQQAAAQEGRGIVAEAQREIEDALPQIKAQIAQQLRHATAELEKRQISLAKELAEKILGRPLPVERG